MKVNKLLKSVSASIEDRELLNTLIILGCKCPTLVRLNVTGDDSDRVINKCIQNVLENAYGDKNIFPRVQVKQSSHSTFLKGNVERYQASVIAAIAKRIDMPEKIRTNRYVEALIAIYQTYLLLMETDAPSAAMSFNDMLETILGLGNGDVSTVRCSNCSAATVHNQKRGLQYKCIACQAHQHPQFSAAYLEQQRRKFC